MGKPRHDLTGKRFNFLRVIKFVRTNPGGNSVWECVCDCGATHEATANNLKIGTIKSCGCYKKLRASAQSYYKL